MTSSDSSANYAAGAEQVDHVFVHHDANLLDVTVRPDTQPAKKQAQQPQTDETVHTTTEHPFLTTDRGFVDAILLHIGERVQAGNGTTGIVVRLRVVSGTAVRYNLTVHEVHTYLVGDDQWVVHNTNPICGASYGGPGTWQQANETMSPRAAAYQTKITGVSPGYVYEVNGVKFDGYANGVLLDAKGPGYTTFFDQNGMPKPWWNGQYSLIDEARRQVAAAGGFPIIWYVAEQPAAIGINGLLNRAGITGIVVIYSP